MTALATSCGCVSGPSQLDAELGRLRREGDERGREVKLARPSLARRRRPVTAGSYGRRYGRRSVAVSVSGLDPLPVNVDKGRGGQGAHKNYKADDLYPKSSTFFLLPLYHVRYLSHLALQIGSSN